MYKAKFTQQGIERRGLPESYLDVDVEWNEFTPDGWCVEEVYIADVVVARHCGFTGDDRTITLITQP